MEIGKSKDKSGIYLHSRWANKILVFLPFLARLNAVKVSLLVVFQSLVTHTLAASA